MKLDQPNGYFVDGEGRVVLRFSGWSLRQDHTTPDAVESVEYVDNPADLTREVDWRYSTAPPPATLTTDADRLVNDGADEVTIQITLNADADSSRDAQLTIGGETFPLTLEPGVETSEVVTTTKQAGSTITIRLDGDGIQRAETEIEVVAA